MARQPVKCASCNRPVAPTFKNCPHCKSALPEPQAAKPRTQRCGGCSRVYGSKFAACPFCGLANPDGGTVLPENVSNTGGVPYRASTTAASTNSVPEFSADKARGGIFGSDEDAAPGPGLATVIATLIVVGMGLLLAVVQAKNHHVLGPNPLFGRAIKIAIALAVGVVFLVPLAKGRDWREGILDRYAHLGTALLVAGTLAVVSVGGTGYVFGILMEINRRGAVAIEAPARCTVISVRGSPRRGATLSYECMLPDSQMVSGRTYLGTLPLSMSRYFWMPVQRGRFGLWLGDPSDYVGRLQYSLDEAPTRAMDTPPVEPSLPSP